MYVHFTNDKQTFYEFLANITCNLHLNRIVKPVPRLSSICMIKRNTRQRLEGISSHICQWNFFTFSTRSSKPLRSLLSGPTIRDFFIQHALLNVASIIIIIDRIKLGRSFRNDPNMSGLPARHPALLRFLVNNTNIVDRQKLTDSHLNM